MFKLLFSTSGAVKRKQLLIGLICVFVFAWLSFFIWSFITVLLFKHWGVTGDIMASIKEIEKNSPVNYSYILKYETIFTPIFFIIVLSVIGWCKLCLIIKRLRDLALTPWLILAPIAVYLTAFEFGLQRDATAQLPINTTGIICLAIIMVFYTALMFCPSRLKE